MTRRFLPAIALMALGCAPATPPSLLPPSPSAAPMTPAPAAGGDAEGCEHMNEGPAVAVTANLVSMNRERDKVAVTHTRFDVKLTPNAGQNEGYVLLDSDEAAEVQVYLSQDVPFKLMQDGHVIAFDASDKHPLTCPAIQAHYAADLGIGPVELHFGPTPETTVSLVLEHAGGTHDGE